MTLFEFDDGILFYQPFVLNAIDPRRMLILTDNFIYESLDQGDSLANLRRFVVQNFHLWAYGGRLNGEPHPDVFYLGAGNTLQHRVNLGDPIATLTYPGSEVLTLVMDPQNYQTVYVVDTFSRVWASFDKGASWTELTANLPSLSHDIRAVEVFSPDGTIANTVLIVGGLGGVFRMGNPGAADASWTVLSKGLPHGLVLDLHYNVANDVLVAGILGRGAWTLTGFF